MSSSAGSAPQRPAVRPAAVVTHGRPEAIGGALEQLQRLAEEQGVELLFPDEEREKHDLGADDGAVAEADLAVVLGGDGTMLRALQRFLGTGVPVIGANFGRVGFLSSIPRDELERGIARVLGGELEVVELATLDVEAAGSRFVAVKDAVVASGELGRMVELEWSFGGENFGRVPCDGLIC